MVKETGAGVLPRDDRLHPFGGRDFDLPLVKYFLHRAGVYPLLDSRDLEMAVDFATGYLMKAAQDMVDNLGYPQAGGAKPSGVVGLPAATRGAIKKLLRVAYNLAQTPKGPRSLYAVESNSLYSGGSPTFPSPVMTCLPFKSEEEFQLLTEAAQEGERFPSLPRVIDAMEKWTVLMIGIYVPGAEKVLEEGKTALAIPYAIGSQLTARVPHKRPGPYPCAVPILGLDGARTLDALLAGEGWYENPNLAKEQFKLLNRS